MHAEPPVHALRAGRRRRQAERDLHDAAYKGDLATLTRLVDQGVDMEAGDGVSASGELALSKPKGEPGYAITLR